MTLLPLCDQQAIFETDHDLAVGCLLTMLIDPTQFAHIVALARERLAEGYQTYRSQMFDWSWQERRRNVEEELADAIVYCISGAIEKGGRLRP